MRALIIFITLSFLCMALFSLSFAQSKGGRWQFENNGYDTAGWDTIDDNGTLQDSASYSSEPPLQEGISYLLLDTAYVYDYFKIQDNNDLDFDNENIGISAWIYPFVLNDVHFIVNKGRQDSNPKTTNYAMRISLSRNLEFLIRDANNRAQTVASSFTIPDNQWTFVAIFYDYSSQTVYMWNNPGDAPVDTLSFAQSFFSNDDPLSIGAWYNASLSTPAVKEFQGRIDDVRISGRLEDIISSLTTVVPAAKSNAFTGSPSLDIFPNPVRSSNSKVQIRILSSGQDFQDLVINVYNILGQKVFNTTIKGNGYPSMLSWNLKDFNGQKVGAGIYFIQTKFKNDQAIKRFIILK